LSFFPTNSAALRAAHEKVGVLPKSQILVPLELILSKIPEQRKIAARFARGISHPAAPTARLSPSPKIRSHPHRAFGAAAGGQKFISPAPPFPFARLPKDGAKFLGMVKNGQKKAPEVFSAGACGCPF